jgi:hypothetical protein
MARSSLNSRVKNMLMSEFDYSAPAELFATRGRSGLRYRRFSKSAEAIRYAVEKLPAGALSAASLEVNDHRYRAADIRALYDSQRYPLARTPPDRHIYDPSNVSARFSEPSCPRKSRVFA